MNIATVFKQSTTTSAARMSTSRIHHRTELSTLSSINFDNLKRKKISGQLPQHQQSCSKQTKSSVLMESNSVLNVVQELGNDRHHRRNSLSLTDEKLLKILSAPADQPLYINDTANNKVTLNGDINNRIGENLLIQYEAATSSIVDVVDDYENLPPANKCAVASNIEDGNLETMTSTPQRGFGTAAWNKLQRDLNSPSASCRVRAIRAMNSPANDNYYSNFNVTNDESTSTSIAEVERSIEMPRTIEEVMKDVIVYVEVRSGTENRTSGIKSAIANLGAKVNDRLLRNTTHVVFKDGLQSTYNKAKIWNIPIVSILWIEACKKHLILMDPKAYPISNVEKFENPDLYEKTKRQKFIQPDTLMKKLHRPIPKAKLLEGLKRSTTLLSSSSNVIDKTMNSSPNVSSTRKTTPSCLITKATTTIGIKLVDEKPKNTIRSMFQKQFEKSRTLDCSQMNGGDSLVDVTAAAAPPNATKVETEKEEPKASEISNGTCLVTGSLHKRLTRRNSITVQTPTKTAPKSDAFAEISSVLSSVKKRRCTMFMPSKIKIDEDEEDLIGNITSAATTTTTTQDKNSQDGNKTVNKTVEMEICNGPTNDLTKKCNSKVRQMLNTELLLNAPRDKRPNGIANMFAQPNSSVLRRTTYTPQIMDETKVQNNSSITPVSSSTPRRKTMNLNAMASTPRSTMTTSTVPDALMETKSCDAILTPTNKITDLSTAFSTTPLIKSLSKTHIDHIRSSTSKSLLDEYNNTFSSKKTPLTDKRRTIANITMDIIKQRIENINRNASFNRSTTEFHDDSFHSSGIKATPTQVENTEKQTVTTTTTPANPSNGNAGQLKPLKRKLFAPPSLFPENSPLPIATPQKTDKKTASTQKRKRTDIAAGDGEKVVSTEKSRPNNKRPISRRSTLFFEEAPIRKINSNPSVSSSSAMSSTSTLTAPSAKNDIAAPSLVFTSMHQSQIDFISEAVKKLGKFKLENKVSTNTTHLVSLDNRRTVNMLRGLVRGVWILTYDWILKSVDANKWLPETNYEMKNFSKTVEINRIERQAFGRKYRMDLFRNFDCFYLAQNCSCKNLKELITLCYGKIVQNAKDARFYITEHYEPNTDSKNLQLHPNWILDSITAGKIQKLRMYIQEVDKDN